MCVWVSRCHLMCGVQSGHWGPHAERPGTWGRSDEECDIRVSESESEESGAGRSAQLALSLRLT